MNNIIPISRLAELLSVKTGRDEEWCNRFVREYFGIAEAALASGENVSIKGFGSFSLTGNADNPVHFTPDPSLAARVNAPFEAFSPVDLNEGENVDIPRHAAPRQQPEGAAPEEPEKTDVPEKPSAPEFRLIEVPGEDVPLQHDAPAPVPLAEPEPVPEPTPKPMPEPVPPVERLSATPIYTPVPASADDTSSMRAFWFVIVFILGLLVGCAVGFLSHNSITKLITGVDVQAIESELAAPAPDTAAVAAAAPAEAIPLTVADTALSQPASTVAGPAHEPEKKVAKEPRYDTVSSSKFLTTMARNYYNRMEYWVYIYDANPSLGNPNRIKPGTRVRIPDISELPLTGNTADDIRAAKKRSSEIYARY